MPSKTPKFDQALKEILDNLKPQIRKCQQCGKEFKITAEDIEFYKKLQVPPPTLCPDCREQRRAGHRISYLPIFYKKSCSAPGHTEKIISFYPESNPIKVYDDKYYFSDQWEATEFGVDYDPEKDFFEEYNKFVLRIPHQSLFKDPKSTNSEYVVSGLNSVNCYYATVPLRSENIYYAFLTTDSKDSVQICDLQDSELCFDSVSVKKSYKCISIIESSGCVDSAFLYDCRNCQNCFMSANLRNKSYVFRNKQLSKEEYQEKMKEINLGKRSVYEKLKREFDELTKEAIKKNVKIVRSENCVGDDIFNSKNLFLCFTAKLECENDRYCISITNVKDGMDLFGGVSSSSLYESVGFFNSNNIKFSSQIRQSVNIEYSSECNNCENCFACFGLKNKKYHIFNKPYSEEEYWQKVDEIKTKMLERGEYGEFFPLKNSPFAYQDSNAQIEFPLTEEEIKAKGWHWQDEVKSEIDLSKVKTIEAKDVPDDIKDVPDDILKTPVICERTKKPFKITSFELEFYRKMNLPLPTIHPLERIKDLFKYRRSYHLYQTTCAKCGKEIQTVHNPKTTKNVYCEECYNRKVA